MATIKIISGSFPKQQAKFTGTSLEIYTGEETKTYDVALSVIFAMIESRKDEEVTFTIKLFDGNKFKATAHEDVYEKIKQLSVRIGENKTANTIATWLVIGVILALDRKSVV